MSRPSSRFEDGSHVNDHHASVAAVALLVLALFLFLSRGTLALPVVVTGWNLQARLLVTAALLFFAASNLFDDPRFEHDEDL
jgi:hypothetical protein